MFAAFLSPDMTYSCPIWLPKTNRASATETLEDAQDRKLGRFIQNARIKSGDRVLEIGTGWGSFAIKAVKDTGCSVLSLTLSVEQKELAEQKIDEAGLSDKIKVLLCDYRALEVPAEGPFDKIVSIEMLEAVGREFLNTYFACVDKLLKKDCGIAVFQCITIPEAVGGNCRLSSAHADVYRDMNRIQRVTISFEDTSSQADIFRQSLSLSRP
jgi:cyclopropane-fatty-acyl-phospholipid synthase